jgi:hypothetical protein
MTEQTKSDLISKIIQLEYEITTAIIDGHKPSINDKFQEMRSELNTLRCLVFGYESIFCKKNL